MGGTGAWAPALAFQAVRVPGTVLVTGSEWSEWSEWSECGSGLTQFLGCSMELWMRNFMFFSINDLLMHYFT